MRVAALPTGLPMSVHLKVSVPPSGSLLAEPSMLTTAPTKTFWLAPGLAVGATLVVAVAVVVPPPPHPDKLAQSAKMPMKARSDLRKWRLWFTGSIRINLGFV